MKNNNYRLQFITHHNDRYSYIDSARLALKGGCRWVQLRMKGADTATLELTAREVQSLCRVYDATFIIDDDVWLAKRIGADGVHLGKEDMPLREAREILGEGSIIGATVNSFEDISACLHRAKPDYFGCGPFRFTTTKEQLAPTLGTEGYSNILHKMQAANIDIPIIAIGGISSTDIEALLGCGLNGIALSGAVLNADNPTDEMNKITNIIYGNNLYNNKKLEQ